MKNKTVTKPSVEIKHPDGKTVFRLWFLEAGQTCKCSPASCHEFTANNTASVIYEVQDMHGHRCEENPLNAPSIWACVQEHMQNAFNNLPVA